jgi:carboxyl-terminal processing protease
VASGLVNRVAMNYLDQNREQLISKYSKLAQYKQSFETPEILLQELTELATKEEITFDQEAYNHSKALIKLQIKALIARDLHSISDYYQIMNDENQSFKAALRIINDTDLYNNGLGRHN